MRALELGHEPAVRPSEAQARDVHEDEDDAEMPYAALDYWIRANVAAIDAGKRLLGDRFMVLNFEQLCTQPETEIDRMIAFMGRDDVDAAQRSALAALPKLPSSAGRYKENDLSVFTQDQLDIVRSFGCTVD